MDESAFSALSDDIVLNIFGKLEEDPRHWARLACVCTRFSSIVRHYCWKNKCPQVLPSLLSDSPGSACLLKLAVCCPGLLHAGVVASSDESKWRSHLACGNWNLRREQGCKLLGRQFRDDCLYICDWPGCVHSGEKRRYCLFRGVFKDFKGSCVWRAINDGNCTEIEIGCAFCACTHTWDLRSAFCLRRGLGWCHDDGEPVVRAYVCDNGHVSGAWTDMPLFS